MVYLYTWIIGLKMKQKLLVYFTIIINTVYLLWRAFYTLPLSYGILAIVLAITLLIAELSAFF